jgi:hypothetical protein
VKNKIIFSLVFLLSILVSCNENTNQTQSSVNFYKNTPARISFDTLKHDFGDILGGEQVSFSFNFKNIGGKPLYINDVKTDCGCTSAKYNREPIAPDNKGSINVIFNSEGFSGNTFKSMKVFTNASKDPIELEIAAFIKISEIIEN